MAKWVRVLLAEGLLADGSRLFSQATWRQLTTLVTPMPIGNPPPEAAVLRPNFHGCGLGLDLFDYRGRKVVTHTGGLPDFVSRVLANYAGTYRDAWYGDITIALEQDRLVMRFTRTPSLAGTLEHWQYDTFVVRWADRELRADAFVTFALNPDGTIDRATMRAVSPETDFSFDFQDLLLRPVR
jgi:hypothetical protein